MAGKSPPRRVLWMLLGLLLLVPILALFFILPGLLAPQQVALPSATLPPTPTVRVALATPAPEVTATTTRRPTLLRTPEPLVIPSPPAGGAIFSYLPDPGLTGWVASDEPASHWGDQNLRAGFFQNQIYASVVRFDLTDLPPGSKILFAMLELTGRDDTRLGSQGEWRIELVNGRPNEFWAQASPNDILNLPALAVIGRRLNVSDLGAGVTNRVEFEQSQRQLIEKQLDSGFLNLRIKGPVSGDDNLFAWEGMASRAPNPPTLNLSVIPAQYVVVTNTPTPGNVLTAAAVAFQSTALARQVGTPTRVRGVATPTLGPEIIFVTPAPTPANSATAQYLSIYATAVAVTTGTFTPTPANVRVVTVTPTPVLIGSDKLFSNPTATPTPGHGALLGMAIPKELKGKIVMLSNRYQASLNLPALPTPDSQSSGATVDRTTFGANIPIVINPDDGRVIGVLSSEDLYQAAVWREAYSPDRRQVAYTSAENTSLPQIQIFDFSSNLKTIVSFIRRNVASPAALAAWSPAWSPDGRFIVYIANECGNDDLFVYDIENKTTKRLTNCEWPWNKHPSWSPDGQRIVFWSNRITGNPQIWTMSATGENLVNLSNNIYNEINPVWLK